MQIKNVFITLLSIILGLMLLQNVSFSEDSNQSPYNRQCSATKTGRLVISPTSLEFYVNQEQNKNPEPITVLLTGVAFPNCTDANCTKEKIHPVHCRYTTNGAGEVNGTFCYEDADPYADATAAHNIIWAENLDFCWIAAPSDQWIVINNKPAGVAINSSTGTGHFTVTVDVNRLIDSNALYTGSTTVKQGWIQVTTTIHDPSVPGDNETYMRTSVDTIKEHVTATLSDWSISDELPISEQISTWWIPVKVYINSLHEAQQQAVATTDWMDLTLNVPISDDIEGALYILAEHPSLAPGQVYAYRIINGQPQFDLFSSWGNPVPGAEQLFFARDVQNTPIALPFSSHNEEILTTSIPYKPTNVGLSSNDNPNVKAFIPVAFGGGIRLIGMEGDWIIRAIVGDPNNITNYRSWRELLYYVLHIKPITGRWLVTEEYGGESFTYIDNGIIYPLILNEERGKLNGAWITPNGQTVLAVNYSNPTDGVCKQFTIQGQRILIDSCIKPGKYDIYFTENTIWGPFEYLYRIDYFDVETGGRIEGQWQYRTIGDLSWSVPEKFYAVTQDVVIPLDPSCNCYSIDGKVNGVATPFIVDTGASFVSLDLDDARLYDFYDVNGTLGKVENEVFIPCDKGTLSTANGDVDAFICYADSVEIAGKLKIENVPIVFTPNLGSQALLGMSFLQHFHVTTNSKDGTMVISK